VVKISMTLISTITVGAGGAANIDFTSIPATFTDLFCQISFRADTAGPSFYVQYNNSTGTAYSLRRLTGDGAGPGSSNQSGLNFHRLDGSGAGTGQTANTFSSFSFYIPNYAGSATKTTSFDGVTENNATASHQTIAAGLFNSTAAITSVLIDSDGNFVQHTIASLYGITKGSGGATVS
jgi:hypothetical protein